MMDIIALRDIAPNEEIFLDYGPEWTEAWRSHVERFQTMKLPREEDRMYISASDYIRATNVENAVIRTVSEQESDPYPDNLQTVCFYDVGDDNDDDNDDDEVEEEERESNDSGKPVVYKSWNNVKSYNCLRPCIILDRYYQQNEEVLLYKAQMLPISSSLVLDGCQLDAPHIVTDILPHGIRIVNRPYASDMFMEKAFRHEIGVPDGLYPELWRKKKLREQTSTNNVENDDLFKRRGTK
jgi:hypothetical protein